MGSHSVSASISFNLGISSKHLESRPITSYYQFNRAEIRDKAVQPMHHPRCSWLYGKSMMWNTRHPGALIVVFIYCTADKPHESHNWLPHAIALLSDLHINIMLWYFLRIYWQYTIVYIFSWFLYHYIDGLVQDCSISSALAMEILQSCTKPSIWYYADQRLSAIAFLYLILDVEIHTKMVNLNPAWISNHMRGKLSYEITYPFPNFNGSNVEVWEWISN